jgi:hypothetical protein
VVDADCIARYQHERIRGVEEHATTAVRHILENGSIVLDEQELILQQWLDTATGPSELSLRDWVADQMASGGIKLRPMISDRNVRRELNKLGLPRKDQGLLQLGKSAEAFGVVTEDIDLFEPTAKKWPGPKKQKLKQEQRGSVCNFARKKLDLSVMPLSLVRDTIPPCDGAC